MPRRVKETDPIPAVIKERALKKMLVDSEKCVRRSRELIAGSRQAIEAQRERRKRMKDKRR